MLRVALFLGLLLAGTISGGMAVRDRKSSGFPFHNLLDQEVSQEASKLIDDVVSNIKDGQVVHPLLFFPGTSGSRLEMNLHKKSHEPHFYCSKTADWFPVWIAVQEFVHGVRDCWLENMKMVCDDEFHCHDPEGVEVRGIDFGGTAGVRSLEPRLKEKSSYMGKFFDILNKIGYTDGKNLRAATYDWREDVRNWWDEGTGFFPRVQALIEEMYSDAGNVPVALMGHSFGGPAIALFLGYYVDQDWKDKYIHNYLDVGGPFGGSPETVQIVTTGTNYDLPFLEVSEMHKNIKTWPSLGTVMPFPKYYDTYSINIVTDKGYWNMNNLTKFWKEYNLEFNQKKQDIYQDMMYNIPAPGVETHVMYGKNVTVYSCFDYRGKPKGIHELPAICGGIDGDGTVSLGSALGLPETWQATQAIEYHEYLDVSHFGLIVLDALLAEVIKLIISKN